MQNRKISDKERAAKVKLWTNPTGYTLTIECSCCGEIKGPRDAKNCYLCTACVILHCKDSMASLKKLDQNRKAMVHSWKNTFNNKQPITSKCSCCGTEKDCWAEDDSYLCSACDNVNNK